jgi:hypothetical protein
MPKNKKFKIIDGTETKEVEAMSYKKAVKSYQGSSKSKMITIEWMTKAGELFVKDQKIPLGRKKKLR